MLVLHGSLFYSWILLAVIFLAIFTFTFTSSQFIDRFSTIVLCKHKKSVLVLFSILWWGVVATFCLLSHSRMSVWLPRNDLYIFCGEVHAHSVRWFRLNLFTHHTSLLSIKDNFTFRWVGGVGSSCDHVIWHWCMCRHRCTKGVRTCCRKVIQSDDCLII